MYFERWELIGWDRGSQLWIWRWAELNWGSEGKNHLSRAEKRSSVVRERLLFPPREIFRVSNQLRIEIG